MAADVYAVISATNNKGGVGKTSASVNLAVTLGGLGYRVLFIDADPQANGTKALGVRGKFDPATQSLWAAFRGRLNYSEVAVETPYKNVAAIAATQELEDAPDHFSSSPRRWKLFKQLLPGAENDFNFVIIDTPPAKGGILTPAALAASDYYIIPSFADSDSYDGFVKIISLCEEIKENENDKLTCLGVLITCLKKNPANSAYLEYVVSLLGDANIPIFPHYIAQSDSVDTARLLNKPAVVLPNANVIRDGYLANAKHFAAQVKESKSGRPRKGPDLSKLGLIHLPSITKHDDSDIVVNSDRIDIQF